VKEQVKEKPDIKKLIKQESPVKNHFKPLCLKGYCFPFTTFALQPPDNRYFAPQAADCLCHLKNTLVVTDAVGNRKHNLKLVRMIFHYENLYANLKF
jgi:hypothetical protein